MYDFYRLVKVETDQTKIKRFRDKSDKNEDNRKKETVKRTT